MRICVDCNSYTTYIRVSGIPQWHVKNGKSQCQKCKSKEKWVEIKNNPEKLKMINKYQTTQRSNKREHYRKYLREWNKNNKQKSDKYHKNMLNKCAEPFNLSYEAYRYALRSWSLAVKVRDNHKCIDCGSGKKLNAHHILPKITHPEFSLIESNGITVCQECHYKYTYGEKK